MKHGGLLIGLEWGSTRACAYLLGSGGTVIAVNALPWNAQTTQPLAFESVYRRLVAPWRSAAAIEVIVSGPIVAPGPPACRCPVGADDVARGLTTFRLADGAQVHRIPGVAQGDAPPDLLCGEETRLIGALALAPQMANLATVVIPGTPGRWVTVEQGRITRFATYKTEELHAALRQRARSGRPPLGEPERDDESAEDAFDRGLGIARAGQAQPGATRYQTSSPVLAGLLGAQTSSTYLWGLLIGDEVRAALDGATKEFLLVGDPQTCWRYGRALNAFDVRPTIVDGAAPAGLWEVAQRAGLVDPARRRG